MCSSENEVASHVWLFATPWTIAHQAPLSMGFSRQEYWSALPFPSPGDLSDPRDRTQVSCIAGRCFNLWANREAQCILGIGKNGNFLLASLGLICYVLIKNNERLCKVLNTFFFKKNSDFHLQSFEIIKVRDRTFRHFQRKWFEVILWGTMSMSMEEPQKQS